MLCYDSFKNEFFNTDNANYINDINICEATKGVDVNTVIEKWYFPSLLDNNEVIYKRDIATLFDSNDRITKLREFYFDLNFKKIDLPKTIRGIILPPKQFIMFQGSSKFIK